MLYYNKYSLAYFLQTMIDEGYSDTEIQEFIEVLKDHFKMIESLEVFVRKDKLSLVRWCESLPDYFFIIEYFGLAIEYEAVDIAHYFIINEASMIENNKSEIPHTCSEPSCTAPEYMISKSLSLESICSSVMYSTYKR